jgi:hypothetical protein
MKSKLKRALLADEIDVDFEANLPADVAARVPVGAEGRKVKLFLRNDATIAEFLHEAQHIEHIKEIGAVEYFKLWHSPGGKRITEQYAYDRMRAYHWDVLTPDEQVRELLNIRTYGGRPW